MLMAMLTVIVATVVAYSFLGSQSTSIGIARNVRHASTARYIAESGLAITVKYIQSTSDWRTQKSNGNWVTDVALSGGTFTVRVEDGEDTNGDGIVEGDGDLADDPNERATISVTGVTNGVSHIARAIVTPVPGGGLNVLMLVNDPDNLTAIEQNRKSLIESGGSTVTLIDDNSSVADIEAGILGKDLLYIPSSVSIVGANASFNYGIPIASESSEMIPEVGFASAAGTINSDQIDIVNNTHAVTNEFLATAMTVSSAASTLPHATGTLAGGATVLAEDVGGSNAMVVAIDAGKMLHGSSGIGLNASYYTLGFSPSTLSDINFSGTPTATGVIANVNQASTSGAGWSGGPSDNFAVKYTASIAIPAAGTWTFYTNSDDGSKLWIDGTEVVDNDGLHGMRTRSGSITLTAGPHTFEVRGFERGGGYGLIAYWQGPTVSSQTVIPSSAFTNGAAAGRRVFLPFGNLTSAQMTNDAKNLFKKAIQWAGQRPGVNVEYFDTGCCKSQLSGVNFGATPTFTEKSPNINIGQTNGAVWAGGPSNDFAVRFSGQVNIAQAGNWTFYTNSDDGSKLWINGTEVVDNDGLHSMTTQSGTINLAAGLHDIEVRAFERSGDFGIIAYWQGPGVSSQTIIPTDALTTGGGSGGYTYRIDWIPSP